MMRFYDKQKNNERIQTLADALARRDNTPINTGSVNANIGGNVNNTSVADGATGLVNGATGLYNGLKQSGLFDGHNDGAIAHGIRDYIDGSNLTDSPTYNNITGAGTGDNMIDSIASNGASGSFNAVPLIGNAIGGLNGFASTGNWKDGIQGAFGTGSKDSANRYAQQLHNEQDRYYNGQGYLGQLPILY